MANNDISNEQISWGLWLVENRPKLRRLLIIALVALDAVLVGFAGFGFGDWFFGSGVRERRELATLSRDLTEFAAIRQATAPKNIVLEDALVVAAGSGRYDVAVRATNTNAQWWVEFEYSIAGQPARKGFLLPGESKYLHALGVRTESRPSADAAITSVAWHRVDLHVTRPDYASWSAARLNLAISDVAFAPAQSGDAVSVNRASFRVLNDTAYGYRTVGFFVRLVSASRTVGVNYVTISDFRAGESRLVDATWFSELPNITRVEVQPEVNIFDVQSYLAF